MVLWLSSKILSFVSRFVQIPPEMKDIYQYGIEITISFIFNVVLVLLCSIALTDMLAGIVYLFIFIILRSFTGGYHAKTYLKCNAIMVLTFVITFILYKITTHYALPSYVCELITLLNLIPIIKFAPVTNNNKPLTDLEKNILINFRF